MGISCLGFPGGTVVKNLPPNAGASEDLDLILGLEEPLEEDMATHSNILAWKISWTEEPGGLQSIGRRKWQPIQYPCLENLMDRGAW